MVAQSIFRFASYVTASLVLMLGVIIVTGLMPAYVPTNFRIIVGSVMIIYGAYRIVILTLKQRDAKGLEE